MATAWGQPLVFRRTARKTIRERANRRTAKVRTQQQPHEIAMLSNSKTMATTEQQLDSSTANESEHDFTAILSEEGCKEINMVHRHSSGLINEYRLNITSDGWSFKVVDASNVAMMDVTIPKSVFESYEHTEDIEVGVDADRLNDVLQDGDGLTTVTYDHDERTFVVDGTDIEAIDKDSVRMTPDAPDLNLMTKGVIEDIELFTHFIDSTKGHVQISGSDNGFALHHDGDIRDDVLLLPEGNGSTMEYSTNEGESVEHERVIDMHDGNEADVSLFSRDYLKNTFKNLLVRHTRDVSYELEIGTQFPLYLTRKDDTDIDITVMIAPRITS